MSNIGLYCPAETGHLNTMLPLGQELQKRGHRVTYIGVLDAQEKVEIAKLEFIPIGVEKIPLGATKFNFAELAKMQGIAAIFYTMDWIRETAEVFLEEAPEIIKKAKIDILIVDQISPEGGTVCNYLNIPFVTLCSALPFNQEAGIPPFYTTWLYNSAPWLKWRNALIYQLTNPLGNPIKNLRKKYRRKWNLPPETNSDSPDLILSHQPAEFEFPRQKLPSHFYFTGPYNSPNSRKQIDFPWSELTGKPLIYASMGTLQTGLTQVFQTIAEACHNFANNHKDFQSDIQLVISLGGAEIPDELTKLPGNPIVVKYAPQLELLQKAQLFITHAGMNSALEALTYGVPMVAIPVTNDQPGIAARIVWSGMGELVALNQLNTRKLENAIAQVFTQPKYQQKALEFKAAVQASGGVVKAANLIEEKFKLIANSY